MICSRSLRPGLRLLTRPKCLAPTRKHFSTGNLSAHIGRSQSRSLGVVMCTFVSTLALYEYNTLRNDSQKADEAQSSVNVDKSVAPFPSTLTPPDYPLTTKYTLLGYGTRSVTFLNFKVYALGIYAAEEDLKLIPKILSTKFLSTAFIDTDSSLPHSENVHAALIDPGKSRVLVSNLIDAGIRMVAKITPIRNTDFNHLKDGLIKSILNHPDAKNNQEILGKGIQELKDAFIRKGSVPKNDDLLLELQANGSLQLYYCSRKQKEKIELGRVDEPIVGKLLFSEYLSGPKPLSKGTRDSFVAKISKMI